MSSVLVGMFDSQGDATKARSELMAAGFSSAAVTMTGGSTTSTPSGATEPHEESGGIGHFFRNLFGSEEDTASKGYTDHYTEAFRRGGYGVSVTTANDVEMDKAQQIFNANGAVDIDEKSQQWKKEGWTGAAMTGGTAAVSQGTVEAGATRKLQEIEEEIQVGKRVVAKGGVRVFSRVVEVPVQESVQLREEHADIQRRVVDRPATEADFAAFKEGSIEVRNTAEEAVVGKTARVVGEVEIGKTSTEHEEVIRDTVRKTKVEVEQIVDADLKPTSTGMPSGTKPI